MLFFRCWRWWWETRPVWPILILLWSQQWSSLYVPLHLASPCSQCTPAHSWTWPAHCCSRTNKWYVCGPFTRVNKLFLALFSCVYFLVLVFVLHWLFTFFSGCSHWNLWGNVILVNSFYMILFWKETDSFVLIPDIWRKRKPAYIVPPVKLSKSIFSSMT